MDRRRLFELGAAALVMVAWFACAGVLRPDWLGRASAGEAPSVLGEPGGGASTVPQSVVDSLRPVAEELARFREGLGRPAPRELEGAERSRDLLVRAFVRALERSDTAGLAALTMNAAEFAYFYYPYTNYTHPPYTQPPGLVWLLTEQNGRKGLVRLLRRLGDSRIDYRGHSCGRVEPQDLNLLHLDCRVLIGADAVPTQLFGTIIERGGRFKFVSYSNGL